MLIEVSSGDAVELFALAERVLKAEAKTHRNASFSTFSKLNVLTIHTARNVMILSSVSLFEVTELRTAEIPLAWEHRELWFHMFDFLALIMVRFQFVLLFLARSQSRIQEILLEQETIYRQLEQEDDKGGVQLGDAIWSRMDHSYFQD